MDKRIMSIDKSQNHLDWLWNTSKGLYSQGLDANYRDQLYSSQLGRLDQWFNEAADTNREALASAGLGASGLSAVANSKLAAERAGAVNELDANISNMDWQAKMQGLQGLFGVQQGQQGVANYWENKRQFDENLNFQKEQAEYGWGDFFGDVLGAGARVGSTYAIAKSDKRLKENIKVVGKKDGIEIVQFNYKKDPSKRYEGVIAQDIQEKYPNAVVEKDGYLAVDYSKIPVDFKEVG